ncbi:hypothetical protein ACFC58_03285 [Kitasatospora purpeofusca]|uniref:hypothetical protein n=1 Tax=Kitasatospora purpeofusca TaxID=67352 RepID=UPI0035D5617B
MPEPAASGIELPTSAPLEPPSAATTPPTDLPLPPTTPSGPPTEHPAANPSINAHQPLATDDIVLVDEAGDELPRDLATLFDLTHPEWTVVQPKVRIYQRRTYTGSRRTTTQLLYTPAQSIPRAEFDQLRNSLSWE